MQDIISGFYRNGKRKRPTHATNHIHTWIHSVELVMSLHMQGRHPITKTKSVWWDSDCQWSLQATEMSSYGAGSVTSIRCNRLLGNACTLLKNNLRYLFCKCVYTYIYMHVCIPYWYCLDATFDYVISNMLWFFHTRRCPWTHSWIWLTNALSKVYL